MLENSRGPQCVHLLIARPPRFSAGLWSMIWNKPLFGPPTKIGGIARTQLRELHVQGWGVLEMRLRQGGRAGNDGNANLWTHLLRELQGRMDGHKAGCHSVKQRPVSSDHLEGVHTMGSPGPGEGAESFCALQHSIIFSNHWLRWTKPTAFVFHIKL